jgi:murein tripeptide amidase MpaA
VVPILLLAMPPAAMAADAPTYSLVRIADSAANVGRVAELGIALEGAAREANELEVAADERELRALTDSGVPFEVIIEDLAAFYEERAAAESHLWQGLIPQDGFGFGSMGGYYTNDEVIAKLDEMRTNYPNLISEKQAFSVTLEGRDLWMSKISDNPDIAEGEPATLYTALTHSREPQGMATIVYYMFYLLENYGVDPEVTYLVDNRELYFAPVLNPDGYVYNETQNPNGGGMWRKNRRDNGNGIYGVDLNRNYGYEWGHDNSGSSPNPGSNTYRGTAPFSELETTGVRFFHQGRTILNSLHYHSYGNWEIHPFSYEPNTFPPGDDYMWFLVYGQAISAMNGYVVGTPYQTVGYPVNGDAGDWSYGEQTEKNKVFVFIPEVGTSGDGFWPAPSRIVPIAELNREPNVYFAWVAGGRVEDAQIAAGPEVLRGMYSDVVVTLTNIGLTVADDVSVEVTSTDPYVEDIVNPPSFPAIPAQSSGDNQSDPSSFLVSAAAPIGHVIELGVTVRQRDVVMSQSTVQVTVIGTTGVVAGDVPSIAGQIAIAAHPNPFNPRTELSVDVVRAGAVRLAIYETSGRLVRVLIEEERAAGRHRVMFDGRDGAGRELPSGIYVARLTASGNVATIRIALLR